MRICPDFLHDLLCLGIGRLKTVLQFTGKFLTSEGRDITIPRKAMSGDFDHCFINGNKHRFE